MKYLRLETTIDDLQSSYPQFYKKFPSELTEYFMTHEESVESEHYIEFELTDELSQLVEKYPEEFI